MTILANDNFADDDLADDNFDYDNSAYDNFAYDSELLGMKNLLTQVICKLRANR